MKKIALALVLIAVLALSLVSCGGFSTPQDAANKAVEAYLKFDYKEFDSYQLVTSEQQLKKTAEANSVSLKEYLEKNFECSSVDEYLEKMGESLKKVAEGSLGKFTVEITKTTVVSYTEDELKNFKEDVKEDYAKYSIDTEKFQDAATCTVSVSIKADQGTEEETLDVIVVKYNGGWKVLGFN